MQVYNIFFSFFYYPATLCFTNRCFILSIDSRHEVHPKKKRMPKSYLQKKIRIDLHKEKHRTLHSGSKHGPLVHSRAQAIAIAYEQAKKHNKKR